jgi:16S rRNA (cytosine1402-N4)-methyltransferase
MMAGSGSVAPISGGAAVRHVPVLGEDAIGALAPDRGGVFVDGTFGAGGYTQLLLAHPGVRVVAIDRDPSALAAGAVLADTSAGRLTLVSGRFADLAGHLDGLGIGTVDGIVLDIGVSSMQLDEAARGFSFRFDGPLDMRMGDEGPTAADVVAAASESTLADILFHYGEERLSRRIARAIVAARANAPIGTTRALADLVARAAPGKPGDIHPATRTFQALRILVNDELGELAGALQAATDRLSAGGRLAVVTFHSLEDRIVKTMLSETGRPDAGSSRHLPMTTPQAPLFRSLTRKPVVASEAEVARNPRSRSAKLRAAERTAAPARPLDLARLLPPVPVMRDVLRGR